MSVHPDPGLPGQASMIPGAKTEAPPGISPAAEENSLDPGTCFQHDLLPGETILKTYDVHVPTQLIPGWLYWLLVICTCGIFYCYWAIYMWCLKKGWCTLPKMSMTRAKMAITSSRRVLVWKTQFDQVKTGKYPFIFKLCCKDKCRDPVDWSTTTFARSYTVDMITEIQLRLNQQAGILCGICCCTELYTSSVRLRFGEFTMDPPDGGMKTMPTSLYKATVANHFASGAFDLAKMGFDLLNMMTPKLEDLNWVDIVSERVSDMDHDIENPKFESSFQGLSDIAKTITSFVAEKRQAVWKPPSNRTGLQMPHAAEPSVAEFASMNLVKDDSCAAPETYLPLANGEQIIASAGDVYLVTFFEKLKVFIFFFLWVLFGFITFWAVAFFVKAVSLLLEIRAKRQDRQGYILTTNRLVHVSIKRRDTILSVCCPSAILCCFPTQQACVVRSLFPKKIESGILARSGTDLAGVFLTNLGALEISFDIKGSLSMLDLDKAESRVIKRLAFLKAIANVASRARVLNASDIKVDSKCVWNTEDRLEAKVLPLIEGNETLVARYTGQIYSDSCEATLPGVCTNSKTWHPGCCLALTCGIKPVFSKTSVLVTDATVYAVKVQENEPFGPGCGPGGLCHLLVKQNEWAIFWTPLSGLAGSEVNSVLVGNETFTTRCCHGKWLGKNFCPMLQSQVAAKLVLRDEASPATVTVMAHDISQFESLRNKPEMIAFRQGVAQVQGLMDPATMV